MLKCRALALKRLFAYPGRDMSRPSTGARTRRQCVVRYNLLAAGEEALDVGDDLALLVERVVEDVLPLGHEEVVGRGVVAVVGEVEVGGRGDRGPGEGAIRGGALGRGAASVVVVGEEGGGEGEGPGVVRAVRDGAGVVPRVRLGRRRRRPRGGVGRLGGLEEPVGAARDAREGGGGGGLVVGVASASLGGVAGRGRAALRVGREAVEKEELGEDVVGFERPVLLVDLRRGRSKGRRRAPRPSLARPPPGRATGRDGTRRDGTPRATGE